jgi:hypothetical protein
VLLPCTLPLFVILIRGHGKDDWLRAGWLRSVVLLYTNEVWQSIIQRVVRQAPVRGLSSGQKSGQ